MRRGRNELAQRILRPDQAQGVRRKREDYGQVYSRTTGRHTSDGRRIKQGATE